MGDHVFVYYSRKDGDFVLKLAAKLKDQGVPLSVGPMQHSLQEARAIFLRRIWCPILTVVLFMIGLSVSIPEESVIPASDILAN
jgi:hypothetical protein